MGFDIKSPNIRAFDFLNASWINPENIGITHFLKGRTQDNSKVAHDFLHFKIYF